jgi:succinylglutamate desuccinylase
MGLTILPSSTDPFNLYLSAYLSKLHPTVRICYGLNCGTDNPMLRSLAPLGCTIEVGAVAQGVQLLSIEFFWIYLVKQR